MIYLDIRINVKKKIYAFDETIVLYKRTRSLNRNSFRHIISLLFLRVFDFIVYKFSTWYNPRRKGKPVSYCNFSQILRNSD